MAPIVTRIDAAGNTQLGEGPHWEPETKSLYFVDINGGSIHKYNPATDTLAKATIEGYTECRVSLIIPIKNQPNKFIISVNRELGIASWDGQSPTAVFERIVEVDAAADVVDNRINDGKCDALGRVWFGTMREADVPLPTGSFYALHGREAKFQFAGVSVSNGLVWNKANTKFYYIDSPTKVIAQFEFDLVTGSITNRKVLTTLPNLNGDPDGMTIDTEDNLWVAVFNGACVMQISTQDGKVLQKVEISAKQITSVAWGGDNLDELYVTTARVTNPSLKAPADGALYKITHTGFKGFPMNEAIL